MRCHTRIFLILTQLLNSFSPATSTDRDIPAEPLLAGFHLAMERAESNMRRNDPRLPVHFKTGGGCYGGFGRVSQQECQAALGLMPSHNLSPDDVTDGPDGQVLTRTFVQCRPLIWKRDGRCVIGVSIYDKPTVKGLYPPFREAASLIIDQCAARGVGGLIRFSHFEVVVFDERLLPTLVPDYIFDFSRRSENIPFSRGLRRLWEQRPRQQVGNEQG
ncbi:hypothetical protein MMC15_003782 [Xylographa vitiligo]|nr:hypothetical protein [Xylographa vitiligo]